MGRVAGEEVECREEGVRETRAAAAVWREAEGERAAALSAADAVRCGVAGNGRGVVLRCADGVNVRNGLCEHFLLCVGDTERWWRVAVQLSGRARKSKDCLCM